jgi:hypothetical protein
MLTIEKDHACNMDVTPDTQERYFGIEWIRSDRLRLNPGRKSKKVWFGICGYSHRICRVTASFIELLVFHGIYIHKGRCEDENSCLARECPLNKTSASTIKKLTGLRSKQIVPLEALTAQRHCGPFQKLSA